MNSGTSHLSQGQSPRNCAVDFSADTATMPPAGQSAFWNYIHILSVGILKLMTRFLQFAVSCLFLFVCRPALCVDFELSGHSTLENFKPDGTKYKIFPGSFSVQKNANKWAIVYSAGGVTTTEHVMFDGKDVYTVWDKIQMPVDKMNGQQSSVSNNNVIYSNGIVYAKSPTVAIYTGEYPLGATFTPRIIWYALLSGSALHKYEDLIFPAPWAASFMPESSSFRLNIEWSESPSEFPDIIKFVASNELWTNSVRAKDFTQKVADASPFEDKFVAGIYRVVLWTNMDSGSGNVSIPLIFEVDRFFPPKYKTKAVISEHYRLQVETIKLKKPAIDRFQINDDVLVNVLDYRFMSKSMPWFYVVYPITNGTWRDTNDPVVLESIYNSKKLFYASHLNMENGAMTSPRKYVIVFLLFTILSAPAIVIVIRLIKFDKKTKKI